MFTIAYLQGTKVYMSIRPAGERRLFLQPVALPFLNSAFHFLNISTGMLTKLVN